MPHIAPRANAQNLELDETSEPGLLKKGKVRQETLGSELFSRHYRVVSSFGSIFVSVAGAQRKIAYMVLPNCCNIFHTRRVRAFVA